MNITDAVQSFYPDAIFTVSNGVLIWQDERPQPSEEEIQAKITELQTEYNAKQYQRDRLAEYPSIQECIHAILDDDLEALQVKRSAVKAKYPKPE